MTDLLKVPGHVVSIFRGQQEATYASHVKQGVFRCLLAFSFLVGLTIIHTQVHSFESELTHLLTTSAIGFGWFMCTLYTVLVSMELDSLVPADEAKKK